MDDVALSVRALGKRYQKGDGAGLGLFSRVDRRKSEFWALRDVSFDVARGTGLGIIGGNGAGKSTLLKILSRIVPPTVGEVEVRGKVNSLLEVGTGFQSDLSGRANIYLNASVLGMTREETDAVFDEIVEFSGVGEFIDMPVKHYSSGMYSRLAFSVAANVTGEILLLDEVLAVGDAEFQKKCLDKMREVTSKEGRTVLFVSHSMEAVLRFCSHALWLDHGRVNAFGAAEDVVGEYLRSVNRLETRYVAGAAAGPADPAPTPAKRLVVPGDRDRPAPSADGAGDGFVPSAVIHVVTITDGDGRQRDLIARNEPVVVGMDCEVRSGAVEIHPVVHVICAPRAGVSEEVHVFTSVGNALPREPGTVRVEARIPGDLLTVGSYVISVALVTRAVPQIRHCKLDRVIRFQVIERTDCEAEFLTEQLFGVIQPRLDWRVGPVVPETSG